MTEDRPPRGALEEVELPSGRTVRGLVTPLLELLRFDLVPTDLMQAVVHYADPSWTDPDEHDDPVEPEENARRKVARIRVLRMLVAHFLRSELIDGEWVRVRASIDDMVPGTSTWSDTDIDALEDVVLRLRTPEMVAADGRLERAADGLRVATLAARGRETQRIADLTAEVEQLAHEAAEVREREAGATVPGLVEFRPKSAGTAPGAAGDAEGTPGDEDEPGAALAAAGGG